MKPGRMRGLLARGGSSASLAGAGVAVGGLLGLVAGGAVASPLLEQAADFDAVAQGIDLDGLAGGATGALESADEQLSSAGEQVSGFGDALSELGIPGLGDLFGR